MGRNHGSQGIRGNRGKGKRKRYGEPELLEELADRLTHTADGYEYRHQRHGSSQDCQHQFLGSICRGQERFLPHLHVPENIFYQHDGVVDQEPDGQGQTHERHVIQGKAHNVHEEKRCNNGCRNRQAANDGCPQVAQEHIGDEKSQEPAKEDRVPHVGHVLADVPALVPDDVHLDIRGQVMLHDLFQFFVDHVNDLDRIGTALLADGQHHGRNPVGAGIGLRVFPVVFHVGNFRETDGLPVFVGHNDLFKVVHRIQLADGTYGNRIVVIPDLAARRVDVSIVNLGQYRLERNSVLLQLF